MTHDLCHVLYLVALKWFHIFISLQIITYHEHSGLSVILHVIFHQPRISPKRLAEPHMPSDDTSDAPQD